jgi:hypothetical protein
MTVARDRGYSGYIVEFFMMRRVAWSRYHEFLGMEGHLCTRATIISSDMVESNEQTLGLLYMANIVEGSRNLTTHRVDDSVKF